MKPTIKNLFTAKKAVEYLNHKPNKTISSILWAAIGTVLLFILVQIFAKYF